MGNIQHTNRNPSWCKDLHKSYDTSSFFEQGKGESKDKVNERVEMIEAIVKVIGPMRSVSDLNTRSLSHKKLPDSFNTTLYQLFYNHVKKTMPIFTQMNGPCSLNLIKGRGKTILLIGEIHCKAWEDKLSLCKGALKASEVLRKVTTNNPTFLDIYLEIGLIEFTTTRGSKRRWGTSGFLGDIVDVNRECINMREGMHPMEWDTPRECLSSRWHYTDIRWREDDIKDRYATNIFMYLWGEWGVGAYGTSAGAIALRGTKKEREKLKNKKIMSWVNKNLQPANVPHPAKYLNKWVDQMKTVLPAFLLQRDPKVVKTIIENRAETQEELDKALSYYSFLRSLKLDDTLNVDGLIIVTSLYALLTIPLFKTFLKALVDSDADKLWDTVHVKGFYKYSPRLKKELDRTTDKKAILDHAKSEYKSLITTNVRIHKNAKILLEVANGKSTDTDSAEIRRAFYRVGLFISDLTVIAMDSYAVARMFKVFNVHEDVNQPKEPNNIIYYSGDAHAFNVGKFITSLPGMKQVAAINNSRCEKLSRHAAVKGDLMCCVEFGEFPQPLFWPIGTSRKGFPIYKVKQEPKKDKCTVVVHPTPDTSIIVKKKCKPGKICNPNSGRCVSKSGAIGRRLLGK